MYGSYPLNNASNDINVLRSLVQTRCGEDKEIVSKYLFGTSTVPLSTDTKRASDLSSNKKTDASNSITPREYSKIKEKYAAFTQIAAQNHAPDTKQTELTNNDLTSKDNTAKLSSQTHKTTNLQDYIKPVSAFVGSTLGNLTGVMNGISSGIPNTIATFLNKTDEKANQILNGAYTALKLEEVGKIATSVLGCAETLVNTVKEAGTLLNDVYDGAIEAMQKVNEIKVMLITQVEQTAIAALDSIIPLDSISSFVDAANTLSDTFSIASINISELEGVSDVLSEYTSSLNQFTDILNNPTEALSEYSNGKVKLAVDEIRTFDASEALNSLIPPQVQKVLDAVSTISTIGIGGNNGGGLFSLMSSSLKNKVSDSACKNHPEQLKMLTSLYETSESTQANRYFIKYNRSNYPTNVTLGTEIQRNPDYKPTPLLQEK